MKESGWTIILPVYDSVNLVGAALEGLARYSTYTHTILLAYSDMPRIGAAGLPVRDNHQLSHCGTSPRIPHPNFIDRPKYTSMAELMDHIQKIDYPHHIRVVDMTEEAIVTRRAIGLQPPEGEILFGYAEIGAKLNLAARLVDTGWVIPYWEDDYYPCPNWDGKLMDTVAQYRGYPVYVSSLVRHWLDTSSDPYPTSVADPWEDFRHINCHSVYINAEYPMTREVWEAYCEEMFRPEAYIEPCGSRMKSLSFPFLMRTDLRLQVRSSESGADPLLSMEDGLSGLGCQKVVSKRSLVGNKLPILITAEELP